MKILVTGYGPFLEHKTNPSFEVAQKMEQLSDAIHSVELPVEFARLNESLDQLDLESFDFIYLLGLAGGRRVVTPEMIAINWLYSPGRPDNQGVSFEKGEKIDASFEDALLSHFPVEELNRFLKERGVLCELSFTAGTYVCNATYFKVLSRMKTKKACFIHMPMDVDIELLAQALVDFSKQLYS